MTPSLARQHQTRPRSSEGARRFGRAQRGVFMVVVALSLVALVGMIGLAVDSGRMFTTRNELQAAADACALAAVAELDCEKAGSNVCIQRATDAGVTAAGLNRFDLQSKSAESQANGSIGVSVSFHDTATSTVGTTTGSERFAVCTASAKSLKNFIVGVLGFESFDASATARATRIPGQGYCNQLPMMLCGNLNVGQVATINYEIAEAPDPNNKNKTLPGVYDKISFSSSKSAFASIDDLSAGGYAAVPDRMAGLTQTCVPASTVQQVRVIPEISGDALVRKTLEAFNSAFGIYSAAPGAPYTAQNAPPDATGYQYANSSSRIREFLTDRSNFVAYQEATAPEVPAGNKTVVRNLQSIPTVNRRLVTVPLADKKGSGSCKSSVLTNPEFGCALLHEPFQGLKGQLRIEYLGLASDPGSPCRGKGVGGDVAGLAPLVPVLVR